MDDPVVRPFWVRPVLRRGTTRNEYLIRSWFMVVAVVLTLLMPVLSSSHLWWMWVTPALLAASTAWTWRVFFWIDRHRAWPRRDL